MAIPFLGGLLAMGLNELGGRYFRGREIDRQKAEVADAMAPVNPLTGEAMSADPNSPVADERGDLTPGRMAQIGQKLMGDPNTRDAGLGLLDQYAAAQRQDVAGAQAMDQQRLQGQQQLDVQGLRNTGEMDIANMQEPRLLAAQRAQADEHAAAMRNQWESRLQTVRDDLQPIVSPVVTASGTMRSALTAPEGFAGDALVVRNYARQLNPTGPLSDRDVASIANDPSADQLVANLIGKWSQGKLLTADERKRIQQASAQLYANNKRSAMSLASPVLQTMHRLGLPASEVFDSSALLDDKELEPYIRGDGISASNGADLSNEEVLRAAAEASGRPMAKGENYTQYMTRLQSENNARRRAK